MTEDLARHTIAALRAIAPELGDPPQENVKAVQCVVDRLIAGLVRHHSSYPSRPDVRKRMQKLRDAADLILREFYGDNDTISKISDPKVFLLRVFMLDPREHSAELDGELGRGLHLLRDLCDTRLDEMPIRGGRDHAVPIMEDALTASGGTVCALTVSILWTAIHGHAPTVDNKNAWKACAELWHAAGGKHLRGHGSGWRNDLSEARNERYNNIKFSIRSTLAHVKRFGT